MASVCHVISQDHVIKGSFDFMGGSLFVVDHHPAKFGRSSLCVSGDIILIYHVISQEYMTQEP